MGWTRGSLTLPRMNAHRLVIVAAALTVAVAAALATALAVFSGQALPRAVRHDLSGASGTALVINGNVNASQAAQYTSTLPGKISSALDGTPFAFYQADWSDPLGFAPGSRPARPASAGNQPIAEAAALGDLTAHASLVSGRWPGAPATGQPIPAALPVAAAALLHVTDGDVLRMQDRISVQVRPVRSHRPVPAPAGLVGVLGPGRRRPGRLEHGQRLHHLRSADRPARGLRRTARRVRGFLAGPAANGEHSR